MLRFFARRLVPTRQPFERVLRAEKKRREGMTWCERMAEQDGPIAPSDLFGAAARDYAAQAQMVSRILDRVPITKAAHPQVAKLLDELDRLNAEVEHWEGLCKEE